MCACAYVCVQVPHVHVWGCAHLGLMAGTPLHPVASSFDLVSWPEELLDPSPGWGSQVPGPPLRVQPGCHLQGACGSSSPRPHQSCLRLPPSLSLQVPDQAQGPRLGAPGHLQPVPLTGRPAPEAALQVLILSTPFPRMGGIPAVNGRGERLLLHIGIIDILQSYRWVPAPHPVVLQVGARAPSSLRSHGWVPAPTLSPHSPVRARSGPVQGWVVGEVSPAD